MGEQENMKKKEAYLKDHSSLKAIYKILSIVVFLFITATTVSADQNDPRLNNLFKKIKPNRKPRRD